MTIPAITPAERFVGPVVFRSVFDRFDVGTGDRFYDSALAYTAPWSGALLVVRSSLLVTSASRGELGSVQYVIKRLNLKTGNWERSAQAVTTQRDFQLMIDLRK